MTKQVMLIMGMQGDASVGIPDSSDTFPTPFYTEGTYKGGRKEREEYYKSICELYERYFFAEGCGYGGRYTDEEGCCDDLTSQNDM